MIVTLFLTLAALGYWIAAIGFQLILHRRETRDWQKWTNLVLVSHAFHTFGLIALTLELHHIPMGNMPQAITTLSWLLIGLHALLGQRWKMEALGTVAAPAAAVLTTYSIFALGTVQVVAPDKGHWFYLHVGCLLASYAAFSLAAGSACLYFIQARRLKSKQLMGAFQLPSLDTLDRAAFRLIRVGFPLLLGGIVSGMLTPGWRWNWDFKEVLVAVTGGVYLVYLYARMVAGWQGRRVNFILLAAYICVLISLLSPGQFHKF